MESASRRPFVCGLFCALECMQWKEHVWWRGKVRIVGHRAVFTTRRAMSVRYGGVRRVSLPCRECTRVCGVTPIVPAG